MKHHKLLAITKLKSHQPYWIIPPPPKHPPSTAHIDLWLRPKAGQIYCQISSFISANTLSFKFELCAWGYFPPGQPCSHSGCPWCNGTLFISSKRSGQITARLPKHFQFCWFLSRELTLELLLEAFMSTNWVICLHPNRFALSHLQHFWVGQLISSHGKHISSQVWIIMTFMAI